MKSTKQSSGFVICLTPIIFSGGVRSFKLGEHHDFKKPNKSQLLQAREFILHFVNSRTLLMAKKTSRLINVTPNELEFELVTPKSGISGIPKELPQQDWR